ncbi:MAG TPA: hypothetical protein VKV95_05195 [Terriglobia bacterium]|nr:hypothetical protein [Terriglobia bacterium]
MNEKYGLKGLVHKLEQRKNKNWLRGSGIDHFSNYESFDLEFSPTGLVLSETSYNHCAEIYGSTHFVYDDAGKLIREIEFDETDTESAITEYEYSARRCTWIRREAGGIVTMRGLKEYQETSLTFSGTYGADGLPRYLQFFEYEGDKLIKKTGKSHGPDGELYEIWISNYDSLGRIRETFGLRPDGEPVGDGRYVFEYDEEGRQRKILSFNDTVDTDVPDSIRRFTYVLDKRGNWVERNDYWRFRSDSAWSKNKTTRKLTYYPQGGG